MSSLSGTGGAIYITGGRKVLSSASWSWSLSFGPGDELAYGQLREISAGLFLLLLAPDKLSPARWSVMLLDRDSSSAWAWQSGKIQFQTEGWLRSLPLVTP